MHRIDTGTQTSIIPALPAQVGAGGFFTNGNSVTGTPPTILDASWFNTIQEEIANAVILLTGQGLDRNNNGQLAGAILQAIINRTPQYTLQAFGTPGTIIWTVPANVFEIEYWLWGAGGGGGASGSIGGGAGGGAGGFVWGAMLVAPGGTMAITIGAGGAPSGTGTTQAQTGGTSSLSIYATAYGGQGGMGGDVGSGTENAGGAGGGVVITGNSAGFQGAPGNDGSLENKAGTGIGGSSMIGGGGRASTTSGAGFAGGYGAGGGGCYGGNGYGGVGGNGFCMIRYSTPRAG